MNSNRKIYTWMAISLITLCVVAFYFVFSPRSASGSQLGKVKVRCERFSPEVSKADGDKIEEIIYTVSHKGSFGLFLKEGHLHSLGRSLDKTVPPLTFLAYIFSRPSMVVDMGRIQVNSMKYNHFVEGLRQNLVSEYQKGCLFEQAKAFSRYLGLNEEDVNSILMQCCENAVVTKNRKAFKPFVNYLIEKKLKKAS